jgi:chromate transporter
VSTPSLQPQPQRVAFSDAVKVWARIGLLSFGGPAGQVALMHQELVVRRRWIDEERFLHALNYCMLLPGPEAQQLATYIGWLMHKTRGGLAAGLLFVLPGFVSILALSLLYAGFGQLPAVAALFFGLKAAVLAVVFEAVLRVGKRALTSRVHVLLAVSAFLAIFFLHVRFPLVVLGAAAFGLVGQRLVPGLFPPPKPNHVDDSQQSVIGLLASAGELGHTRPSRASAGRVLLVCGLLWGLPLLALRMSLGSGSVFVQEGLFFSQAAVVTFGGAYAVLTYIAQEAVATYHWLLPGEMLDGLGLAETTPGPLIMVVQFVGFMGAFRHPGHLPPLLAGVCGSLVTVWVTFVPCFLWIFLGAPYVEALRGSRALRAALSAITAAVVGVILNLSIWFGLHVLFRDLTERSFGPVRLLVPELASLNVGAAVLAALSMLALFRFKLGLPKTLAASAALGAALRLLGAS